MLRDDHARRAYEALAPAYDHLTREHDHASWTALLEDRARAAGLNGTRFLDVACGTGNTLIPMRDRGYEVTGVDISDAMLAEARRKTDGSVTLIPCDLRALSVLGEFDLVWCLGDALNYLDNDADLRAAFRGMGRNLAPDGVVVFDVNTLGTFRAFYSSMLVVPSKERVVVIEGRGSRSLTSGGSAQVWIDRLEPRPSGEWTRTRSEHHRRHHSEATVRSALTAAGLTCHSVLGSMTTGTLDEPLDDLSHAKAVYIARHQAQDQ